MASTLSRALSLHRPMQCSLRPFSSLSESFYNEEQKELIRSAKKLIETEINPHCDKWEKEQMFPAHEVESI